MVAAKEIVHSRYLIDGGRLAYSRLRRIGLRSDGPYLSWDGLSLPNPHPSAGCGNRHDILEGSLG
jgi:hypothetical protein